MPSESLVPCIEREILKKTGFFRHPLQVIENINNTEFKLLGRRVNKLDPYFCQKPKLYILALSSFGPVFHSVFRAAL